VLIDFGGGGADDAATLLQQLRQDWPALPVAAAGLATDPAATPQQAWTAVARVLLNLDETITRA
jgi:hypothetical protein